MLLLSLYYAALFPLSLYSLRLAYFSTANTITSTFGLNPDLL